MNDLRIGRQVANLDGLRLPLAHPEEWARYLTVVGDSLNAVFG